MSQETQPSGSETVFLSVKDMVNVFKICGACVCLELLSGL